MRVIITAGGTRERIDTVRSITNAATGRLGSEIARSLAARGGSRVEKLFYVHGPGAIVPDCAALEPIEVCGVEDLIHALESIAGSGDIGAVVHSMAVSDYSVKAVTTADSMAKAIARGIAANHRALPSTAEELSRAIELSFAEPNSRIYASAKISSELDGLVVALERTPKVIARLREWFPQASIIGFKLLSGVSDEELAAAGLALLRRHGCSYVLANDASALDGGAHVGHLVSPDGSFETLVGKPAIADRLADLILASEKADS